MASSFNKYFASWLDLIPRKMYDNIVKRSPTFTMLTNQKKQWDSGGDTIRPHIKYKQATNGGSYRGYEVLDITPQDTRTDAEFRLKQLYASIVFNGYEEAASNGELAIFKMGEIAMKDAEDLLFDIFSRQLFADGTGNGGRDILGLAAAVDDGTNVANYAGIDRTTNTWWKAQYNGTVGTLTWDALTQYYVQASRGGMVNSPDYFVAGLTAWLAVNELVSQKYQTHSLVSETGRMIAKLGFPVVEFMGKPVVYDEYCPAGDLYMLNTETIQWYNKKFAQPSEMVKPPNMDAKIGQLFTYGELICTEPRANVHLKGITGA